MVAMTLVLVNQRTDEALAERVEVAVTRRDRRKGLLGRSGLAPASALVMAPCFSIHTCARSTGFFMPRAPGPGSLYARPPHCTVENTPSMVLSAFDRYCWMLAIARFMHCPGDDAASHGCHACAVIASSHPSAGHDVPVEARISSAERRRPSAPHVTAAAYPP